VTPADLLLGLDVGTSSAKAAVIGADGVEVAHGRAPTPWQRVPTGAQVDPEALFAATVDAARAALAAAPPGRVRAIGVASMAEAGVLLDGHGRPLHPAIAWHDARGADEARRLAAELPDFAARTGLPPTPLCSLVKLAHLQPLAGRARRWLSVGEWLVRRLGGDEVGELSLASRTGMLDLVTRRPYADGLAWAGLPADLPAPAAPAGTPAGTATLAEARGAVLAVAGHDHLVAGVGVGVVAPGDMLDSCGTAEALVRVVAPPLQSEQVVRAVEGGVTVGWHVAPERQALMGALWSGLALGEVLDALGVEASDRAALAAAARDAPAGEVAPLELDLRPAGERRPARLPGAAPHLVWRAAVEAAAREAQRIVDHVDAVAGPRRRMVVTGGWARDEAVMAAKRALGAEPAGAVVEAGCRGAALLAGVAAGLYPDADHLPPPPAG
jgi:sugar (pentulose or hexulose) kinase